MKAKGGRRSLSAKAARVVAWFLSVVIFCVWPRLGQAQEVSRVGQFSVLNGEVQFLPGGIVEVEEDGRTKYLQYKEHEFKAVSQVPANIVDWTSFGGTYDYLDQLSIASFEPGLSKALPIGCKVKQVVDVQLHGKEIVGVVYSVQTSDASDDGILHTAFFRQTGSVQMPNYELLLTDQQDIGVAYGALVHYSIPRVGTFMALYWSQPTGNAVVFGLDVYRFRMGARQSAKLRKR